MYSCLVITFGPTRLTDPPVTKAVLIEISHSDTRRPSSLKKNGPILCCITSFNALVDYSPTFHLTVHITLHLLQLVQVTAPKDTEQMIRISDIPHVSNKNC